MIGVNGLGGIVAAESRVPNVIASEWCQACVC